MLLEENPQVPISVIDKQFSLFFSDFISPRRTKAMNASYVHTEFIGIWERRIKSCLSAKPVLHLIYEYTIIKWEEKKAMHSNREIVSIGFESVKNA